MYILKNIEEKRSGMVGRHAQAATEFLMTYGWAIIVGVLGLATLVYFGVLDIEKFLPNRCILPSGLSCADYKVETYRIILFVQNDQNEPITIDEISASANNQECVYNQSTLLLSNEKALLILEQCNNGASGTKFDGTINVTYTPADKLSHILQGRLKSKVEGGSPISGQSICQNAENSSLCDGLDLVYGTGYKDACCGEHGLCC